MDTFKTVSKSVVTFALIIGGSIVVAALIGAFTLTNLRSLDDVLSVTGSAKTRVTSDSVKWVGNFQRVVSPSNLKSGYDSMNRDLAIVKRFYADQGITADMINISQVYMDQDYGKQYAGAGERDYILRQTVEVNSPDVAKIRDLAKNISPIVEQGVLFSTQSLEFYYSKLPELRVSLLSDAVKDAKARAEKLAGSTGKKVGNLKSASSGVVQVLSANSVDVSDYGSYDTQNVEKDVMITVKATFSLK